MLHTRLGCCSLQTVLRLSLSLLWSLSGAQPQLTALKYTWNICRVTFSRQYWSDAFQGQVRHAWNFSQIRQRILLSSPNPNPPFPKPIPILNCTFKFLHQGQSGMGHTRRARHQLCWCCDSCFYQDLSPNPLGRTLSLFKYPTSPKWTGADTRGPNPTT